MNRRTPFRSIREKINALGIPFYLALVLLPLNDIAIAGLQYSLFAAPGNLYVTAGIAALVVLLYFVFTPWLEFIYDREVRATYESSIPMRHSERFHDLLSTVNNAYYTEAFHNDRKLGKTSLSKLPVYVNAKYELVKSSLHVTVHLGVFFYLLPHLFLPAFILLGLSFYAKYRLYKKRVDYHLVNVEEDRTAEYFRNILLDPKAMHDLKVFGAERTIANRSISAFESGLHKRYQLRRKNALGYPLVKALSVLAVGVILLSIASGTGIGSAFGIAGEGLRAGADFSANLPTLVVAMTAIWGIVTQMEPLCDRYFEYKEAKTLLVKSEVQTREYAKYPSGGVEIEHIEEIRFERVSFAYEGGRPILKDLNFAWSIDTGSSGISLIGENGAGKTTLVKLLLGINQPTSGTIYVNRIPLSELNLQSYLRCFGFCMQDYVIYADELLNNITFGDETRTAAFLKSQTNEGWDDYRDDDGVDGSKDEDRDCNGDEDRDDNRNEDRERDGDGNTNKKENEIFRILGFLPTLPNGLRTNIGADLYDDGITLSGGQEQRLALARAMVSGRATPRSLLVLDEPTSALDPEMEHEVFEGFRRLVRSNPVFLITHRLGYANLCGRILVMRDGAIVEDGDHETLMRQNGQYAQMYAAQSQMFFAQTRAAADGRMHHDSTNSTNSTDSTNTESETSDKESKYYA